VRITLGEAWIMPTLDVFIGSSTHEKDKPIKMGEMKNYKRHALSMHESIKSKLKSKQKGKGKRDIDQTKGGNFKPSNESSNSKYIKGKQGKSECDYCNHDHHPKSSCMKKTMDLMAQTLR